jgi:hypothetical protein
MTIDERISHDLKQHLPDVDEAGVWEHIEMASVAARRRRSALMAAASVAAATALVVGWIGLTNLDTSRLSVTSDPAQGDVPFEQMATIRQLVDAINARDAEPFIDAFTTGGYFNPHGDFRESSSVFGEHQPVSQVPLVEAWMAIIDTWGLEADLRACSLLTEAGETGGLETGGLGGTWGWPRSGAGASLVLCDVATRWHKLSLELTEGWVYEFRGTQLDNWGFVLLDLNPGARTLPLGYDGLEAWESWLVANDPLSADRYLNPRVRPSEATCADDSCGQFEAALAPNDPELAARLGRLLWSAEKEWLIDGHEFRPSGLIPYDPAVADEIEASIQEYLGSQ